MLENMAGAHSRGSQFQRQINKSKIIHISNLMILKPNFLLFSFFFKVSFISGEDLKQDLWILWISLSYSSRELSFITLNQLIGSWDLSVLLSLTPRSKMDETLPVYRGADIISGVFCSLEKFVLIGFIKGLCPEKEKCCTS